ncbi:hypothetical protein [Bradyrhizobium sp. SRS-191]|uniref:hypothetical protein n=1 Tax=Bradyrhizobium sp. SRS-191 TaxID=2962606 RepID=UPI00211E8415|nr:hypothetical protein [Bradyrhizobium sp. SRS-191]
MTKKFAAAEHQASLDSNFPYLERDAEPPGRWVPNSPRGKRWEGQAHWSTRHGDAVVRWGLGEPVRIDFALYPDRTRGVVEQNGYGGWRRLARNARNWIHGTVQIRADDVTFSDGEQPVYHPPPLTSVPSLEADLARDTAFLKALQDDGFAGATYDVLKQHRFYKDKMCGWLGGGGDAAGLVADLRGLGESFQDWHPWGGIHNEARLRSVHEHLARIGWRVEGENDQE